MSASPRNRRPCLLEWQAQGATFDVLELGVTAGADVAFAWALLRCGTAVDHTAHPERGRTRVTGSVLVPGRGRRR